MIPTLLQTVALVGGTVHSMAPGVEPAVATILIEDGRIQAVGADLDVPDGWEVLDLTGLHLTPGLIDGAINHDIEHDPLYVSCGVTLARDTGNRLEIISHKARESRDFMPGPDLLIAGQALDGSRGATTDSVVLRSDRDVGAVLGRLFADLEARGLELDYLSILEGLPLPAWRAVVAFAHERDKQVWGPLPSQSTLKEAALVGQDGVLGLQGILPPAKAWHQVEAADLEEGIAILAENPVAVTPLVGVYGRLLADYPEQPEVLSVLGPHYRVAWRAELDRWRKALPGEVRAATEKAVALQRGALKRLWTAGVKLVPGSAAPNPWLAPGTGLVDELEHFVRAGIPPIEVLRLATASSAAALGVADARGTLEAGKVADVVVLGADPRLSIGGFRDPELVVLRGRVLEREDLAALRERMVERQAAIQAELARPIEVAPPRVPEGAVVLDGRADTSVYGQRLSAERFAVVRMFDGRTAYCTRVVTPQTASESGRDVHLVMVYEGNRLHGFDMSIRPLVDPETGPPETGPPETGPPETGPPETDDGVPDAPQDGDAPQEDGVPEETEPRAVGAGDVAADQGPPPIDFSTAVYTAQGALVGESARMSIQRRLNGILIDNKTSDDPVNVVDVSNALLGIIAAQHFPDGTSFALSFEGEGLEPFVDRWQLAVQPDHQLQIRTSRGWMRFAIGATGAPLAGLRRAGNANLYVEVSEVRTFGGPGLPPKAERIVAADAGEGAAPGGGEVEPGGGDR